MLCLIVNMSGSKGESILLSAAKENALMQLEDENPATSTEATGVVPTLTDHQSYAVNPFSKPQQEVATLDSDGETTSITMLENEGVMEEDESAEQQSLNDGADAAEFRPIKSYLEISVLVAIFCFMPTGICAIVKSVKVLNMNKAGLRDEAEKHVDDVYLWIGISICLGMVLYLFGPSILISVLIHH